jgi:hypothetical protein
MRRWILVLAATATIVALAAPASFAKGSNWTVTIALDGGRTATMAAPGSEVWERGAGLFEADLKQASHPGLRLGPGYVATITGPCPNGGAFTLRQTIYPYPALGPWTYTAPGQAYCGSASPPAGWFAAPKDLFPALTAAGLPATPPAARTAAGHVSPTAPDAPPWLPIVLAAAGLIGLIAAGATMGRSTLGRRATHA